MWGAAVVMPAAPYFFACIYGIGDISAPHPRHRCAPPIRPMVFESIGDVRQQAHVIDRRCRPCQTRRSGADVARRLEQGQRRIRLLAHEVGEVANWFN
jgi:hypothetical protein